MKLHHHLLWSTAAAAPALLRRPRTAAVAWAASLLADIDHLVWFCLAHRSADLRAALRYFTAPPDDADWRDAPLLLHAPAVPLVLVALGRRGSGRLPRLASAVGVGLAFHQGLDFLGDLAYQLRRRRHRSRRERLKVEVKRRDGFTCQKCGQRGEPLEVHHRVQPQAGGHDEAANLVTLCPPCHDRAHGRPPRHRPAAPGLVEEM